MKTIMVKEMKAHWATVEAQVREPGSEAVQRLIESQEEPLAIWEIQEIGTQGGI